MANAARQAADLFAALDSDYFTLTDPGQGEQVDIGNRTGGIVTTSTSIDAPAVDGSPIGTRLVHMNSTAGANGINDPGDGGSSIALLADEEAIVCILCQSSGTSTVNSKAWLGKIYRYGIT